MGDTGFMDRHRGRVAFDHAVVASLRGGTVIATLSAAYTMPDEGMTYFLDAGGAARNVILPAAADNLGRSLVVVNTANAAETLSVRETTSGTVRATLGQNEQAVLACNGTRWFGIVGTST